MSAEQYIKDVRSPLAKLIGELDVRPYKTVDLPGVEGAQVALWCLTQAECDRAKAAALAYMRGTLKFSEMDLAYTPGAFDDNVAIETLALAMRDPNDARQPFAKDGAEVRRLGPKALGALHEEYVQFVAERSPLSQADDLEKEVDSLCEALKAGQPGDAWCRSFDGTSARRLLPILADRLARLMNAPCSPLSSPSDSDPPPSTS